MTIIYALIVLFVTMLGSTITIQYDRILYSYSLYLMYVEQPILYPQQKL